MATLFFAVASLLAIFQPRLAYFLSDLSRSRTRVRAKGRTRCMSYMMLALWFSYVLMLSAPLLLYDAYMMQMDALQFDIREIFRCIDSYCFNDLVYLSKKIRFQIKKLMSYFSYYLLQISPSFCNTKCTAGKNNTDSNRTSDYSANTPCCILNG